VSNPKLVPVTILVPPPPDTHDIVPGRKPKNDEPHLWWNINEWAEGYNEDGEGDVIIYAFPRAKTKRLMTPAELAGKWIHMDYGCAHMVISIDMDENATHRIQAGTGWSDISKLHELGCTYSTTPDGERLPLETDAPLKAEGGQQ